MVDVFVVGQMYWYRRKDTVPTPKSLAPKRQGSVHEGQGSRHSWDKDRGSLHSGYQFDPFVSPGPRDAESSQECYLCIDSFAAIMPTAEHFTFNGSDLTPAGMSLAEIMTATNLPALETPAHSEGCDDMAP
eukprot:gene5598-5565_t